ncbi:alpha/beta hydrolase [candidate division KSB1 bacterium]|nr:alpha/beta hydrolase [candidate division KSB1 bacterium]
MKKILTISLILIALIIVLPFITGLFYSPNNEIPGNYIGKKVEINGRMLRYYQTGNGEDILFIHGSMGSVEDWETLYPLLKDRYRMTAFDRPGMGFSDIIGDDYTIEGNVKIVWELIKKLDLKNVTIVGHSRGGAIALRMAIDYNENIKGYLLLAPTGYMYDDYNAGFFTTRMISIPIYGEGLLVFIGPIIGSGKVEKNLLRYMKGDEALFPENFIPFRKKLWNKAISLATRARQTDSYNNEIVKYVNQYAQIKHSVSIISGENDYRQIVMQNDRLAKEIPNSKYVKLKSINHYIQYARPNEVVKALDELSENN